MGKSGRQDNRRHRISAFLGGEAGSMTIVTLIFFVILVTIGGLGIDIGRVYALHGQMIAYVDDAALASASQLDGQGGAWKRACNAVLGNPCLTQTARFGPIVVPSPEWLDGSANMNGTAPLVVSQIIFLSALGPGPGPTPAAGDSVVCTFDGSGPINCPSSADSTIKFVAITTVPKTLGYFLLPLGKLLAGLSSTSTAFTSSTLTVQATAGYRQSLCNTVPFMLCNPNEATQGPGASFTPVAGQQLHLLDGQLGPGTFGLINTLGNNPSGSQIRTGASALNPDSSCTTTTVTPASGYKAGPVGQGMDVRFDIYGGPMTSNDSTIPPALDVIKGGDGKCPAGRSSTSMPMPDDNCFGNGTTTNTCPGTSVGDGNWNRNVYWAENHPGIAQPPGYSAMTRYQVYEYELSNALNPPQATEKGSPACYKGTPAPSNIDRRVVYVAVINCVANGPVKQGVPVPVLAVAKVFLTGPTGDPLSWATKSVTAGGSTYTFPASTGQDDTYGEVISAVPPNDPTGLLHAYPVLYR
jgi:Putative Flp pilus-assembly TadE/G-like